jgi:hypothetical protein
MKAVLNIKLGLLALTALYAFYSFPTGYFLLVACFSVISYIISQDFSAPIGVIIVMILMRWLGNVLKPSKQGFQVSAPIPPPPRKDKLEEGFQAKDPITIHQRITSQKKASPKAGDPTGVLESANILDNFHISELKAGEEGFANSAMPATLNMTNQQIPTPADSSMPRNMGATPAPMANPALIGGRDLEGEYVATNSMKGSSLVTNAASNSQGTDMGVPAPYS